MLQSGQIPGQKPLQPNQSNGQRKICLRYTWLRGIWNQQTLYYDQPNMFLMLLSQLRGPTTLVGHCPLNM